MSEKKQPVELQLGAAYYPEHWSEEHWQEDIRRMKQAGLTVVRMGEFAWSTLEPREGEFCFDWLERAIEMLAENGINTVLGTPTAGPPAWLTQRHPDMLAMDEFGRRAQHGNRCHYCVTSPEFHAATVRLVKAMAERFGQNPHVIGWQIDNEFNRVCYCERCRSLFQTYLEGKYGSLDSLNEHWTTRYWSQTYTACDQIPMPIGSHNPGLMLEFKRFITDCYARYQRLQLDNLRPHLRKGVWVTHNFMGWYDGYDHYKMSEDLDMAAWDWYIIHGHHDYLTSGAIHDLVRGFKHQNFWLIETQPGNVNWAKVNSVLDKGEGRAMAWHAIGHGADAVLYWQWRSSLGGQEQYHGTLVDQSGQPRPFFEEVCQLGRDFAKVGSLLVDSKPIAKVALLNDYLSRWSIEWQPHHAEFDYVAHLTHYYRPFAERNIPVDVVSADASLPDYRLVIAPALLLIDEDRAKRLKEYVQRGGHLVLTIRCGMKDEYNALLPCRQPGLLSEIAGVEVEEYYALLEPVPVKGNNFSGESRQWAERLKIRDEKQTMIVARYGKSNGWLDDQVAATVHPFGKGMVYTMGTYLDETAQSAFIEHVSNLVGIRPLMITPAGVEVCQRIDSRNVPIKIIINHKPIEQHLPLQTPLIDHLNDKRVEGELTLPPYGIAVVTPEE